MAAHPRQLSIDKLLECPITGSRFLDPVIAGDGHTYERQAIKQWLQEHRTSPMTREAMSIDSLRPNYKIKELLEIEKKAEGQNYRFKLDVDVKKKGNRALFRNGDKSIYEAEWLNNVQGPEIVLLHIRGARALKEASFYVKLSRHPNIVRTYGIVDPINELDLGVMLLQEYAPLGDLYELLLNETVLPNNCHVFYEIFLQIIDAMSYFASMGIVHGDLACRNILVFHFHRTNPYEILVKLTDFGLTRGSVIYQPTNNAASTINTIPFRSSAPEILQSPSDQQSYTEKSDVFSMGVLMWECLSKGAIPWIDLTEEEIKRKVLGGKRLERPRNSSCSEQLWSIILKCMAHNPEDRPTFVQLDRLISNLFSHREPLNVRYAQYTSLQYQDNDETNSVHRPTTAAAVSTNESRQQTVSASEEKLVRLCGPMIIDKGGRTVAYPSDRSELFELCGSNVYSSGVHRIRLEIGVATEYAHFDFFGIISGNANYQPEMTDIARMACAYGLSTCSVYRQGRAFFNEKAPLIRRGVNIIGLTLDCVNHKISYYIIDRGCQSPKLDILIDTQVCPFPWRWHFNLSEKKWYLKLISN